MTVEEILEGVIEDASSDYEAWLESEGTEGHQAVDALARAIRTITRAYNNELGLIRQ